MSAVLGDNTTKFEAGSSTSNWIDKPYNGELRSWSDEYEASALANASTIQMTPSGLIPSGARIKAIRVFHDDMGSTVTISLGDSTSATRYLDATSVTSAGMQEANKVDGFDYEIGTNSADDELLITTAGIFTGTLKWEVLYTV